MRRIFRKEIAYRGSTRNLGMIRGFIHAKPSQIKHIMVEKYSNI